MFKHLAYYVIKHLKGKTRCTKPILITSTIQCIVHILCVISVKCTYALTAVMHQCIAGTSRDNPIIMQMMMIES